MMVVNYFYIGHDVNVIKTLYNKIMLLYITFCLLSSIYLCRGCCCCQCWYEYMVNKTQNDIVKWYQYTTQANEEINIMFVIGDITKAAKPNPEAEMTDDIKSEKWYFTNSAIVNAANPRLRGGNGIDKCIHSCFKNLHMHTALAKNEDIPEHYTKDTQTINGIQQTIWLLNASQTLVDTVTDITPTVDYFHYEKIFHTISVCKNIKNKPSSDKIYKDTYKNIFGLACENGIKYLFIPCLGTGEWGYPIEDAIKNYATATFEFLSNIEQHVSLTHIVFVFYYGTNEYNKIESYYNKLFEVFTKKVDKNALVEQKDYVAQKFYMPKEAKIEKYLY